MPRFVTVLAVLALCVAAQEAPLRWVDGRATLRTTLKAGDKVYECNLIVDLGAAGGLSLHKNAAGTLRAETATVVAGDLTLADVAVGRGDDEWLEAFTARWSEELREVPAAGFIGLDGLLSDSTRPIVVIDGARGRLRVADRAAWPDPAPAGAAPFRVLRDESGLRFMASVGRDGETPIQVFMKERENTAPKKVDDADGQTASRTWRLGVVPIATLAPWHPGSAARLGAQVFAQGTWWIDVEQHRALLLPTPGAAVAADEVAYAEAAWKGDGALPEFFKKHKESRWTEAAAQRLMIEALRETPPDADAAADHAVAWLGATPAGRRASTAAKLLEQLPPVPEFDPFREDVIGLTLKDARADLDGTAQAKLRYERAEILRTRGDLDGAFRDLLSASFGMPHDGRPQLALARLHEARDEHDRARARYLRAVMDAERTAIDAWVALAAFDAKRGGDPATFTRRAAEELEGRIPEFHPLPPDAPASRPAKRPRGLLVEIFTGAQCPPCAAADLAVDGLDEAWPEDHVVALAWHLPIPAPEPMVAPCADARAERYGVRGTPTVVVGGNHAFSGGGKPDQAQTVFDKLLAEVKEAEAERFDVRIDGGARRDGDSVTVDLRADGDAGGLVFHAALVEKVIAFPGRNAIVFHRQVARAHVSGAAKAGAFAGTFSLKAVASDLEARVSEVEERGPFKIRPTVPNPELLAVVAWAENGKGVVVDAIELPVRAAKNP